MDEGIQNVRCVNLRMVPLLVEVILRSSTKFEESSDDSLHNDGLMVKSEAKLKSI